jgi:hypothetical protein
MTDVKEILNALTKYVTALEDSLGRTSYANDRHVYVAHLAEAAAMYALVYRGESLLMLKERVAAERHNYGWGYLQGDEGAATESAFHEFATFVERL